MNQHRRRFLLVFTVLLTVVSFAVMAGGQKESKAASGSAGSAQKPVTLRILWQQWQPADALAAVANKYSDVTGGKVKVEMDALSTDLWFQKWLAAAQAHQYQWDLEVLDSQWIGMAIDLQQIADLTDHAKTMAFEKEVPKTFLKFYEPDPTGKGKIWTLPLETDLEMLIYRKDLFDNPQNKAAFKAKYGYDLQVPQTWQQLYDAAQFFNDPAKKFYGFVTKWGKSYDVITWDFDQVLWDFGGTFWNPNTKKVAGYTNSPTAVKALQFYKSLVKFAPPGSEDAAFNAVTNDMSQGLVAMAIQWSSFAPSIVDPSKSKVADKVGFAIIPRGPGGHFVSLGGMPLSVSALTPHKQQALKFLDWFYQPDQLWAYAEKGGHPAYTPILNSQRFWNILPQNKILWESMPFARDIWNIAPYPQLLDISQEYLNDAIRGAMTPKEALDTIVSKQQPILDSYFALHPNVHGLY